ncbi:hypothetical protein HHI36_013008 [Cryptolaemus montrouzieri]|uniref:PiggyBac transposable element-derived protein domain-containing protein n=1 Tax=Cryptolaemus montrouzieri TaxID=559131 RepID=A0ABD2NH07_9CUCU
MKKNPRGELCQQKSGEVIATKWHDNSIVTIPIPSNCHGLIYITVDYIVFVNEKRSEIQEDCQAIIKMYKYMGGVDRFDENVDSMRYSSIAPTSAHTNSQFSKMIFQSVQAKKKSAGVLKEEPEKDFQHCFEK